jgi:ribosomal protein S18 acetylase RimI-like enzyme
MSGEIHKLFRKNLPEIIRSEDVVTGILSDKSNHIIERRYGDKLIGVSVINGNVILLLCVDEAFQNRGIGSDLLRLSEAYIARGNYEKITLGAGNDYIMPGVPMNGGAERFFERRGYVNSWGENGSFDMILELENFTYNEHSIGDIIDEITYRRASPADMDNVVKCARDADISFMQYYAEKSLYDENSTTLVLIAAKNDEVLGAVMVGIEVDFKGIGTLACTATVHKHRGRGIATNMVLIGTKHMKDMGLGRAFLSFTYAEILGMYGRAGYKIYMEYFMGEKWIISI